jgi:2-polyprenyl-6-methoxyphenol hydroxylase-like FAD-dependent oxidoreductase
VIDVLVVGGGPVGLAAAIRCAMAGLSVTVAEPRSAPIDKACGEGVMPAAVRRLAALGVAPDGYPLRGIRYRDDRHQADTRFRHGDGLGVRRTVLQAALGERAAALGVTVLRARVTGLERHRDHVTAAGVTARYLVAADGLHSVIRRLLDREPAAGSGVAGATRPGPRPGPPPWHPGGGSRAPVPRYGLRRHYCLAPWTDLVEVHLAPGTEAYVTPVAPDVVGIAVLFARDRTARGEAPDQVNRDDVTGASGPVGGPDDGGPDDGGPDDGGPDGFEARLSAFPALRERLAGAAPASGVRGAGPLRQDVRRRVHGRVLLVGDASGYLDALTGEGIGVGLAQAEVLAACLAADRPEDYERAWRKVSGPAWRLTAGLLWSRSQPLLSSRIVPAAQHLPWLFTAIVNRVAEA